MREIEKSGSVDKEGACLEDQPEGAIDKGLTLLLPSLQLRTSSDRSFLEFEISPDIVTANSEQSQMIHFLSPFSSLFNVKVLRTLSDAA